MHTIYIKISIYRKSNSQSRNFGIHKSLHTQQQAKKLEKYSTRKAHFNFHTFSDTITRSLWQAILQQQLLPALISTTQPCLHTTYTYIKVYTSLYICCKWRCSTHNADLMLCHLKLLLQHEYGDIKNETKTSKMTHFCYKNKQIS